ncbi:MAG: hypothetical protein WA687_04210 [Solirubrobacterales bacterium]
MIRNFRTLGVALVAVFAFSALAASAASAQQGKLTTDGSTVTLTAEETPGSALLANSLTGPLGSVTCDGSKYTGHKYTLESETGGVPKNHPLIPVNATTVTITPHYTTHCTAHIPVLGTRPVTVTPNGCDYVFHIGQTTGGANTYGVTADVVCPPNKKIEVHIYKTGSVGHPDADAICTIKVGEANNQGLAGAHLLNTPTPDDVDLTGTFLDIHTESTGTLCGTTTSETADLDIDVTVKGHNSVGVDTGVTVTD